MTIRWVTGFFDFPAREFGAARDFWLGVTGYALSPPRGPRGDFAALVPGDGDAYLRVQRIYDSPAGSHLDFHAADRAALAARAARAARTGRTGARQVHAEDRLAVFRFPGGLPFCVSGADGGPGRRPVAGAAVVPGARDSGGHVLPEANGAAGTTVKTAERASAPWPWMAASWTHGRPLR